jgi:hypothetical protein
MIVVNNYLAHFHNIIASGPLGGLLSVSRIRAKWRQKRTYDHRGRK